MCAFTGINVDRACFSDALISDQDPSLRTAFLRLEVTAVLKLLESPQVQHTHRGRQINLYINDLYRDR